MLLFKKNYNGVMVLLFVEKNEDNERTSDGSWQGEERWRRWGRGRDGFFLLNILVLFLGRDDFLNILILFSCLEYLLTFHIYRILLTFHVWVCL